MLSPSESPNDAVIPIISVISATEVSLAAFEDLSIQDWGNGE